MAITNIVLSYNRVHRKTTDLLCGLASMGIRDVVVLCLPWVDFKNHIPLFTHRPRPILDVSPRELCFNLGYRYVEVNNYDVVIDFLNGQKNNIAKILIAGAGVIPVQIIEKYNIINAHPGILPYVRGLDALKWSILKNMPIGVTLYICGAEVDTGKLITRQELILKPTDTFYSVAWRLYELEIRLLVGSINIDINNINGEELGTSYKDMHGWKVESKPHRRMSAGKEIFLERLLSKKILNMFSGSGEASNG